MARGVLWAHVERHSAWSGSVSGRPGALAGPAEMAGWRNGGLARGCSRAVPVLPVCHAKKFVIQKRGLAIVIRKRHTKNTPSEKRPPGGRLASYKNHFGATRPAVAPCFPFSLRAATESLATEGSATEGPATEKARLSLPAPPGGSFPRGASLRAVSARASRPALLVPLSRRSGAAKKITEPALAPPARRRVPLTLWAPDAVGP